MTPIATVVMVFKCDVEWGRPDGSIVGQIPGRRPRSFPVDTSHVFLQHTLDLHPASLDTVESTRIEPFLGENRVILD